ncbi:hypothetical protein HYX08_05010 [Candidatus Woesearchaeota archaeon]|nr:hypothetical protein [Candidatus Woesearchaeota archaeon]
MTTPNATETGNAELSDITNAAFKAMKQTNGLHVIDMPRNGNGHAAYPMTTQTHADKDNLAKAQKQKYNGLTEDGWRFVQKVGAPHFNRRRREMAGYKKIGTAVRINYSAHSIDIPVPEGNLKLVVFRPSDRNELVGTFTKINPKYAGLYGGYQSIGDAVASNDFRIFRTYRVPDGVERLTLPMPTMYDGLGRQVNYRTK